MRWMLLCLMVGVPSVFANEVCTSVDTTGWEQGQLNRLEGTAYVLAYKAGFDASPDATTKKLHVRGNIVCFTDPTFSLSILTPTALLSQMATDDAANAAAVSDQASKRASAESKLKVKAGLTDAELTAIGF